MGDPQPIGGRGDENKTIIGLKFIRFNSSSRGNSDENKTIIGLK